MDESKIVGSSPVFTPTEFIAVANQSFENIFQSVKVTGELSSFRVSKNKWLYFDVKDENSKVKCFGTVFQLKTALEDGMKIEVIATPRLHNQYGFSLNVTSVKPVGEGSIKKAADILQAKLEKEGLFSPERKRVIERAPDRVGLIASEHSAAFVDFIKILNARWQGVEVELYDAQVQGELAVESIVSGMNYFNQTSEPPEVIVVTRGGGSVDDLSVFSSEQVVRSVASSRIPTLVAIGHEIDISLAELAADLRASTPSNAAEILFPDKSDVRRQLIKERRLLGDKIEQHLESRFTVLDETKNSLLHQVELVLQEKNQDLQHAKALLNSVHPRTTLKRGYAVIQHKGKLVSSVKQLSRGELIDIKLRDGDSRAKVQ